MTTTITILAIIAFLFGIALMPIAACRLHVIENTSEVPEDALWSIRTELVFGFCVAAGGFYFETCFLRGWKLLIPAAVLLCLFVSLGSHVRYNQSLASLKLEQDTRADLQRCHLILTGGLLLSTAAIETLLYLLIVL